MFRIGIDTGGTFTDVVALDLTTGRIFTTKTPTTVHDPSIGVLEGIEKALALAGGGDLASISHGTTVATNALLEEQFPGLGLVTTEGFRHILEIARQAVPKGYGNSYFWVKPDRIVPLHRVREVTERTSFEGAVIRPFDECSAVEAARWLARHGVTNIGVSFIHAYANPAHEHRMRTILERECPGAHVSISSEVLPEYREYERTVTTLVDAFVKSRVAVYVGAIQDSLDQRLGAGIPFYVMKSNGGVISAREVARQPITTILSGPAAGALGASAVAATAGFERVLGADVGGTSTDVCLVEGGAPGLTTEGAVQTFVQRHDRLDYGAVDAHVERLEGLAHEALRREGFAEDAMQCLRTADLRYFGQAWEVRVDLPPGAIDQAQGAEIVRRFHDAHERRFGYSYRDVREAGPGRHVVEWVNLRVTGIGPIRRPQFPEPPRGDGRVERARIGRRPVRFDGQLLECSVYSRDRLEPGDVIEEPAIVEEYGATTVVFPGLRAEVDRFGNVLLTRS